MSFSDLIMALFDNRQLIFEIKYAPDTVALREDWLGQTVPLEQVAQLSILQSGVQFILAIYPKTHQLNLQKIRQLISHDLRFVAAEQVVHSFQSILKQPASTAAANVIIDEELSNHDTVYFEAPRACSLLSVATDQLEKLAAKVLMGSSFSDLRAGMLPRRSSNAEHAAIDLKQRMAKISRLPAMPDMPAKILALRNSPTSTVDDLIAIIETDPALSAQIMRYAGSALFRHHSQAQSLKDAIFRVLGYETVLHLSLGYALGRIFKLPEQGPLGSQFFWQHSIYSAALVQQLSHAMPKSKRPKPGLAYLAGLLHDIGYLVLYMFFRSEYEWLNKMLQNHPDQSLLVIESRLLGVSHNQLGAWLFKAWNLPPELLCAVEQHHNLDYQGPHAHYVQLLNLSERLLKMHGISDADSDEIPPQLLTMLGLDEEEVYLITDKVLQDRATLHDMAHAVAG
ncbi:MAG: HDOD domain-containing protein [Gammaproteobacteria bacterium]|nr:HDOD domain-containing protein [Gammaproteobacteria bacterium]